MRICDYCDNKATTKIKDEDFDSGVAEVCDSCAKDFYDVNPAIPEPDDVIGGAPI